MHAPIDAVAPLVDDWDVTVAEVADALSAYWDDNKDSNEDLDDQMGSRGPAADMALNAHRLG